MSHFYGKKKVFRESAVILSNEEEEIVTPVEETENPLKQKSRLEILQEQLQKAIEEENYEEAARLRDEIKQLKQRDN